MKLRSLIAGVAIILIANGFALIHAAINRMGAPDAVITLTKLEANYRYTAPSDDDSGVTLYLTWANPFSSSVHTWLDKKKLEELGFDCSVEPQSERAYTFYRRQRPRPAFVAFEYNGPGWQALQEESEKNRAASKAMGREMIFPQIDSATSHLVALDADRDAAALRQRHPDRTATVIVAALISVYPNSPTATRFGTNIRLLSSTIHVPRPFSDQFRGLKQPMPPYKVQLHFGTFHEPWVTGVEIP
jgi:hypothetical protein